MSTKHGLDPSRIVVGTLGMGSLVDEANAHQILATAYDLGISTIDLAPSYGEGRARSVVQKYLRKHPGQVWKIWDKIGMKMYFTRGAPRFERSFPANRVEAVEEVKGALGQLGVGALDVLQVHLPLDLDREAQVLEGIFELKDQGLVRSFGCCNHETEQVVELARSVLKGGHLLTQAQVQMNMIEQRAIVSMVPLCRSLGVTVVANRVFARGLLSYENLGNSKRMRASQRIQNYVVERRTALDAMRRVIREKTSIGFPELALLWVLGPGGADMAVVGFSDKEQLKSLFASDHESISGSFWSDVYSDQRLEGLGLELNPPTFFDTR